MVVSMTLVSPPREIRRPLLDAWSTFSRRHSRLEGRWLRPWKDLVDIWADLKPCGSQHFAASSVEHLPLGT